MWSAGGRGWDVGIRISQVIGIDGSDLREVEVGMWVFESARL